MIVRSVEPIAVISDIHGNLRALKAVLADIAIRGISRTVNLGDSLWGPLDPAGTADLLMQGRAVSIAGNQDRSIIDAPTEMTRNGTHRRTVAQLRSEHLHWLASLPVAAVVDGAYCCHGSPGSIDTSLIEAIGPESVNLKPEEELLRSAAVVRERVILCGHTHIQRTVHLSDGKLLVNPGSVGLPAYADARPFPHIMESGSPHARYAVLSPSPEGLLVEQVSVPYDWQAAAAEALEHGRPDWARWLERGRAQVTDILQE